jgi:hypothetical protein
MDVSIVQRLAGEALGLGGDALDVDYKAGYEEVCVMRGAVGWGIARYRSDGPDAIALRKELYQLARKRSRVVIEGTPYDLVATKRDSFGETAFRVEIRPVRHTRRDRNRSA